ncbi:MAG: HisA/HisF-related TIM barrel protein [Planctomycetaceae bacterium]
MEIIPVIDVLGGVVVRGVGGRRSEYRPIESALVDGSDPIDVANAFRDKLKLSKIYVADLDGIQDARPRYELYRALADAGFSLLVDAGIRDTDEAVAVLSTGATSVIAALETSPGPDHLRALCDTLGPEKVVFSLDLIDGRPLIASDQWKRADPVEIGSSAVEAGIERMIVLDLTHVGVGAGIGTTELCRTLRTRHPKLRIMTGGGVRNSDDIRAICPSGVDGVLVASALHTGAISAGDLQFFRSNTSG